MTTVQFRIPIYDWGITVIIIDSKEDSEVVKELFEEFRISDDEALYNIENENFNGGETYTNANLKKGLILIYRCETTNDFHRVLNHEKRHLMDRIGTIICIRDEMETMAYLDGYVSEKIYQSVLL